MPSMQEALGSIPRVAKSRQMCWYTSVMPALGRWRRDNQQLSLFWRYITSLKATELRSPCHIKQVWIARLGWCSHFFCPLSLSPCTASCSIILGQSIQRFTIFMVHHSHYEKDLGRICHFQWKVRGSYWLGRLCTLDLDLLCLSL